jgi:hypothetical protein
MFNREFEFSVATAAASVMDQPERRETNCVSPLRPKTTPWRTQRSRRVSMNATRHFRRRHLRSQRPSTPAYCWYGFNPSTAVALRVASNAVNIATLSCAQRGRSGEPEVSATALKAFRGGRDPGRVIRDTRHMRARARQELQGTARS